MTCYFSFKNSLEKHKLPPVIPGKVNQVAFVCMFSLYLLCIDATAVTN